MKTIELYYERWLSSDNQTEIHYFIKGTDVYVFGYNPDLLNEDIVNRILEENNYKITGPKKRKELT